MKNLLKNYSRKIITGGAIIGSILGSSYIHAAEVDIKFSENSKYDFQLNGFDTSYGNIYEKNIKTVDEKRYDYNTGRVETTYKQISPSEYYRYIPLIDSLVINKKTWETIKETRINLTNNDYIIAYYKWLNYDDPYGMWYGETQWASNEWKSSLVAQESPMFQVGTGDKFLEVKNNTYDGFHGAYITRTSSHGHSNNNMIFVIPEWDYQEGLYLFEYDVLTPNGYTERGRIMVHVNEIDESKNSDIFLSGAIRTENTIFGDSYYKSGAILATGTPESITITKIEGENIPEINIDLLQNESDWYRHILDEWRWKATSWSVEPKSAELPFYMSNIEAYMTDDRTLHIPSQALNAGNYQIPYRIRVAEEWDFFSSLKSNSYVNIKVIDRIPEMPVNIPTSNDTPTPPPTGNGSGPGGYVPDRPVTPFIPVTPEGEKPLFNAPIIEYKCVAPLQNIDDPRLAEYLTDTLEVSEIHPLDRILTRAEFAKLITNSAKFDIENADLGWLDGFVDLDKDADYAPYIAYVLSRGIMHGQEMEEGRSFRPDDTINRFEASKVLSRLILIDEDAELPKEEDIKTFADIHSFSSLAPYAEYSYQKCLLHGKNTLNGQPIDGTERRFAPFDYITLGETGKILYNMTHKMSEEI